ncbi:MAG: MBOAT family protein [Ignavibacteriae bacterium]|nr:MBOAT family protein [Ignavibacteriota bacterium]
MQNDFLVNIIYDKSNPLIFTSGFFLLAFTIFLLFYSFVYNKKSLRNIYVITFSLYFYYKTSGDFVIVLIGSIVVNYIIGLVIHNTDFKNLRRFSFLLGIFANVCTLAYFKYVNFIVENVNVILGGNFSKVDIFLPIGISFFTFQSISYLTDIFRRNLAPTENILDYTFFVSFFPYIVAGPIVRASEMLPQINNDLIIDKNDVASGFSMICKGIIKKGIFAYYISQYCDLIYGSPLGFSGFENFIAMIGYTVEIYLDFSGYSDIAIGLSRLMGFKIKPNFDSPYKSKNLIDFWKRWHISLSTWLRDYLFLPLNYFYVRHSNKKKYYLLSAYIFATTITMFIAGLWHGSSNKYIIWGSLHGLGLIINRTYLFTVKKRIQKLTLLKFIGRILTIFFILISWVIFRANDFNDAYSSLNLIVFGFDINYIIPFYNARTLFSIFLLVSIILIFLPDILKIKITSIYISLPIYVKAVIFIILIQVILQIQTESIQPFIYYQF